MDSTPIQPVQPELPFDQVPDTSWPQTLEARERDAAMRLWEQGQGSHPDSLTSAEEDPINVSEVFIEKYHWTPHKRVEIRRAVAGLAKEIDEKSKHATIAAVGVVLSEVDGYLHEASVETSYLKGALIDREDDATFDASIVRSDDTVLTMLARHQLFAASLVGQSWPKSYLPARLKPRLDEIKQHILASSDEHVKALWNGAKVSAEQRAQFWDQELKAVNQHPRVIEFQAERRHQSRRR